MEIEKLVLYLFFIFILVIVCFNVIGLLLMFILDKKEDVDMFCKFGVNDWLVLCIFFFEGCMIFFYGVIIGIVFGLLLCWV